MSANYSYPGQAYAHTLTALKGWYEEGSLDIEVSLSSNVNIGSNGTPAASGIVLHGVSTITNPDPYGSVPNGPPTVVAEPGCGANHGLPLYLWPGANDPDISNPGVPAGTPAYGDSTYGPPDFVSVMPLITGQNMTALVATGGYEVETTEFDYGNSLTYATGNYLRAVTSNTLANAGKVTNQRGATVNFNTDGATVVGTDTIVGIVSRGQYVNANRKQALAFWTWFNIGTR